MSSRVIAGGVGAGAWSGRFIVGQNWGESTISTTIGHFYSRCSDLQTLIMYRKELIHLLLDNPMGLAEVAHLLDLPPKDLEDDLHHLQKSLKHSEYRLLVHPARCRKCGFKFKQEKLHKPGKCPHCHETWIQEPLLEVVKD